MAILLLSFDWGSHIGENRVKVVVKEKSWRKIFFSSSLPYAYIIITCWLFKSERKKEEKSGLSSKHIIFSFSFVRVFPAPLCRFCSSLYYDTFFWSRVIPLICMLMSWWAEQRENIFTRGIHIYYFSQSKSSSFIHGRDFHSWSSLFLENTHTYSSRRRNVLCPYFLRFISKWKK